MVLKPLVSLISHIVACSTRISVDTHTQTHTHRQNDYCKSVTLAAHARRGLIRQKCRVEYKHLKLTFLTSKLQNVKLRDFIIVQVPNFITS